MKNLIATFYILALSVAGEASTLKDSRSPDGRYTVSLQSGDTEYPQRLIILDSSTGKAVGRSIIHFISSKSDSPIQQSDNPKVEWNSTSSFFIFTINRQEGIQGQIVALGDTPESIKTSDLGTRFASDSKIVSYKFIGPQQIQVKNRLVLGRDVTVTLTVGPDGSVSGSPE